MGLFDALKNLAAGSGRSTLPIELAQGESERGRFFAARLADGLSVTGGDLVVTDRRVLFTPLNVTDVAQVLSWGLKRAGVPALVAQAPIKVGELVGQPADAGLLTTAQAGRPAALLRLPEIILTDAEGRTQTFGVGASRTSPNMSPANTVARDELVSLINGGG